MVFRYGMIVQNPVMAFAPLHLPQMDILVNYLNSYFSKGIIDLLLDFLFLFFFGNYYTLRFLKRAIFFQEHSCCKKLALLHLSNVYLLPL